MWLTQRTDFSHLEELLVKQVRVTQNQGVFTLLLRQVTVACLGQTSTMARIKRLFFTSF